MARDVEFAVLGGGHNVIQPDALEGFSQSIEQGVEMRITTARHTPYAPAGEGVGKRIFIQLEHDNGAALFVMPVFDGRRDQILETFFSRGPIGGDPSRISLLMPLGRFHANGTYSSGVRATTFGLIMRALMPPVPFHIESMQVESIPLMAARGRRISE
ncbi:MAG: hypothetical protein V3V01_04900 [Acidimicrobiales bacterium]